MRRCRFFTLIEIMVVIAVFVLMMLMMLEFLSSAQRVWSSTAGRGDIFLESKAGMDFVCDLLKNAVVNTERDSGGNFHTSYFGIAGNSDELIFPCRSDVPGNGGVPLYFVWLYRNGADDTLRFSCAPASAVGSASSLTDVSGHGSYSTPAFPASDTVTDTILERVTSFEVIRGRVNASGTGLIWDGAEDDDGDLVSDGNTMELPSVLMVRLGMMTPADYEAYGELSGAAKNSFRAEKELSFSRIIYFNQAEARGRTW